MVISNGSAKKGGRPWGTTKRKAKPRHPHVGGRRGGTKMPTASGKSCIMKLSRQACTRKFDAMSRRKHTIRRDAGRHLTDRQREILGRAWNQYVNRLATGLRLVREGGRRELQPPRAQVASEGTGLQPPHETAGTGPGRHHELNPQGIAQRRDRICLRFTSGPDE